MEEVNQNAELLHYVNRVYLFGSFLDPERDDYGDIDLGVELIRKIDGDEYSKRALKMAHQSKRTFSSFFEQAYYAETLVYQKLKNRNQYLSLHPSTDGVLDITEKKIIYSLGSTL